MSESTDGTMTVRVRDDGPGPGYTGVSVRTVTISDRCPACGGPRGKDTVRGHNFRVDGDWFNVDRWDNPCGHVDYYANVLAEALADVTD